MSLIKLVEDVVRDKVTRKDLHGIQEWDTYVGTIVDLHDKNIKYGYMHFHFFI